MTAAPGIVYRGERLAVIDKPAGLVVHPARGHRGDTLVDVLGDLLGGGEPERPGIVHRLDKDTSGLMIVARDDEAHRRLSAMIKAREVGRSYLALIEGRPASRSGTIDAPLGRDHRAPERRAVRGRGSRDARTHFEVLEVLRGRQPRRGPSRDRPHAPDSRPFRGDRPSRRRRPPLRPCRAPRPRASVPAQRPARVRRPLRRRSAPIRIRAARGPGGRARARSRR